MNGTGEDFYKLAMVHASILGVFFVLVTLAIAVSDFRLVEY